MNNKTIPRTYQEAREELLATIPYKEIRKIVTVEAESHRYYEHEPELGGRLRWSGKWKFEPKLGNNYSDESQNSLWVPSIPCFNYGKRWLYWLPEWLERKYPEAQEVFQAHNEYRAQLYENKDKLSETKEELIHFCRHAIYGRFISFDHRDEKDPTRHLASLCQDYSSITTKHLRSAIELAYLESDGSEDERCLKRKAMALPEHYLRIMEMAFKAGEAYRTECFLYNPPTHSLYAIDKKVENEGRISSTNNPNNSKKFLSRHQALDLIQLRIKNGERYLSPTENAKNWNKDFRSRMLPHLIRGRIFLSKDAIKYSSRSTVKEEVRVNFEKTRRKDVKLRVLEAWLKKELNKKSG